MPKRTVYTCQHENVLSELEARGVYYAKRAYIEQDLEEHTGLVLQVYDWYARQLAKRIPKPLHAEYPVWVSYTEEATMPVRPGTVVLTLEIDDALIQPVNIMKWGRMLNYGYIPLCEEDQKRHNTQLEQLGVSDTKAFLSRFYPAVKRDILQSWHRLFDENVTLGNNDAYGTLWCLRESWLRNVLTPPPGAL